MEEATAGTSTRERVVAVYTRERANRLPSVPVAQAHEDAVYAALHEVRTCSELDARTWIAQDAPVLMPDDLRRNDDPETASAPEDGRWEFDANVTAVFDDMLEKSIPNYRDMRKFVTDAAVWNVDRLSIPGTRYHSVVDLGASRGSGLQPIVDKLGARARYIAVETSEPMLAQLRDRFDGYIASEILWVEDWDLRDGMPHPKWSAAAVLSVLTLQFIPIEYRQTLLRNVYESLSPGGMFILVEKVLGEAEETNKMLVDLYYGMKRENGYTQEAIDRKRLSLEGVLVPLTADFNVQLLRRAGFDLVECVWAWANFRGWVAVKR